MIIDIDDEANNWCYSFPFSGTDVNTWYLLFYFIFICFAFIILCLHRCYNAKLCLFISEFIDSIAPFCTDIMVLGIVTLVCTDVMMQGYYLFIFNSGMDCNIPSQRCGRLYFPMFLFNVGLFTLMYIASFTALAILWSSLPILTFSTDVMWPVLFWCSCIGDGAFRCSLYLSSKLLVDSPIYSSSQSILSHLNQYITLFGPNFAVTPKNPPILECITSLEVACQKVNTNATEELRSEVHRALRYSHPPNPNLEKDEMKALKQLRSEKNKWCWQQIKELQWLWWIGMNTSKKPGSF